MKFWTVFLVMLATMATLSTVQANMDRRPCDHAQPNLRAGEAREFVAQPAPHAVVGEASRSASDVSKEAAAITVNDPLPSATVHAPIQNKSTSVVAMSTGRDLEPEDDGTVSAQTLLAVLICLGSISALLLTFSCVLIVAQYRQQPRDRDSIRSLSSFMMYPA